MKTCANCERDIGNLEPVYDHGDHIVCADCYALLSGNDLAPRPPQDPAEALAHAANDAQAPRHANLRSMRKHSGRGVQTIEQTSKKWKKLYLAGWLLMLSGCGFFCVASGSVAEIGQHPQDDPFYQAMVLIPFGMMVLGLVMAVYSKIMAWWHHG